jgi:hypothetical protein
MGNREAWVAETVSVTRKDGIGVSSNEDWHDDFMIGTNSDEA